MAEAVDLSRLDPIIEQAYAGQGGLIPVLQKAQDAYGYLSPQVLEEVARRLRVSLAKVYGVATFYSQFYLEPRGKHVCKICDGTACHVRGAPVLLSAVKEEYGIDPGETTADGELTVELVYCLGSCALAPVVVMDDQVMGGVDQAKLLKNVDECISNSREADAE